MQFNRLIPELYCSDFARSLAFYTDVLGFTVRYTREEERFAFLEREGAQIMIEQPAEHFSVSPQGRAGEGSRTWLAAALDHPYGRGINLQIEVADIASLHAAVVAAGCVVHVPLEDAWYRVGAFEVGSRQFVVQDPDGYLLRFFQALGERDASSS